MRALVRTVLVLGALALALPAEAAEEVTVSELIALSPEMSGRQVSVEGELVGDYGYRDDGTMWTQLNGGVYVNEPIREGGEPAGGNLGVGVRIPSDQTIGLDHPGGYHYRGPVVRLTGIWRHHDPARQGESFLEVELLEVVAPGRRLDEAVVWWTVIAGSGLLAVAGAIWLLRPKGDDA